MKSDSFIAVGILAILIGSMITLQIGDATKPEYNLSLMIPQKNGNYTKLDYVRFACRDLKSGIKKILFSVWQTGEPAIQVFLQYNCTIGPVEIPEETWEVWDLTLDPPITEEGIIDFTSISITKLDYGMKSQHPALSM